MYKSAPKRQSSNSNKTQQRTYSANRSFTATFKERLNTTKPSRRFSTISLPNMAANQRSKEGKQGKEVKKIVDFDVTAEGKVEYVGELASGRRKYLTRKMVIGNKELFSKVIDFYCMKLNALAEGLPKKEQSLQE